MKQTSNAIKFLMAQYRAIFKSAYFKGLATAAVVTAGLAVAGTSSAVEYTTIDAINTAGAENESLLEIDDTKQTDKDKLSLSVSENTKLSTDINLTLGGSDYPHFVRAMGTGSSGATFTVDAQKHNISIIQDGESGSTMTFGAYNQTVKLQIKNIGTLDIGEGTTVNLTAGDGSGESNPGTSSNQLGVDIDAETININNATVSLLNNTTSASGSSNTNNAILRGQNINISGTEAKVTIGNTALKTVSNNTKSILGWNTREDGNQRTYDGSEIKVTDGAQIILHATDTSTNQGEMKSNGYGAQILGDSLSLDNSYLFVNGHGGILETHTNTFNSSYVEIADGATLHVRPLEVEYDNKTVREASVGKNFNGSMTFNGGTLIVDGLLRFSTGGTLTISDETALTGGAATTETDTTKKKYDNAIFLGIYTFANNQDPGHQKDPKKSFDNSTLTTLNISSGKLNEFLNSTEETVLDEAGKQITDNKGKLILHYGANIDFSDESQVEMSKFAFDSDSGSLGVITLQDPNGYQTGAKIGLTSDQRGQLDGSIIFNAKDMSIGKTLLKDTAKQEDEAYKISSGSNASLAMVFSANKLTLGSEKNSLSEDWLGFDSSATRLGVNKAIAYDEIAFIDGTGTDFTLQDDIVLTRDYYTKDTSGNYTTTLNTTGKITGDNIIIGSRESDKQNGSIEVNGGAWQNTDRQSLTIVSGSLSVTASAVDKNHDGNINDTDTIKDGYDYDDNNRHYYFNSNPSSLTWNGAFVIDGASDTKATISVVGAQGADATLDLSNASITWGSGSITLSGNLEDNSKTDPDSEAGEGILVINANQFQNFIGKGAVDADGAPADTQTKLTIKKDGVLFVDNAITGDINFNKFASGSAAQPGIVSFSGSGSFITNGALSLVTGVDTNNDGDVADTGESSNLDIGDGTIQAQSIAISNRNIASKDKGNVEKDTVTVADGTLVVTSGLTSENATVVFGDGTSGASLVLDDDVTSIGGVVSSNLNFGGTGSTLEVHEGQWSLASGKDITLDGGSTLTVGDDEFERTGTSASLNADNLYVAANSNNTIHAGGVAAFNTLQAANNTVFDISGQLSIAGRDDIDDTRESTELKSVRDAKDAAGVDLTGVKFNVDGANAQLALGSTATNTLVQVERTTTGEGETASSTSTVTVKDELADAVINLSNHGELRLDFTTETHINTDEAKKLKAAIVDSMGNGILNLGNAQLDIVWDDEENLVTKWDNVAEFANVKGVTNDKLLNTLINDVDVGDEVSGQYGAIQTNFDDKTLLKVNGDLGLHNAHDGYFVFNDKNGTKQAVGVSLDRDSSLLLKGEGKIGAITGMDNGNSDVTIAADTDETGAIVQSTTEVLGAITNIDDLDVGNNTVVSGNITANFLGLDANTSLSNGDFAMNYNNVSIARGAELTTKNLTITGRHADSVSNVASSLIMGAVTVADTLTLGEASHQYGTLRNQVTIADGIVIADKLVMNANNDLLIGYDGSGRTDSDPDDGFDETGSYTGKLQVNTATLNGGALILDPTGTEAALASINQFSSAVGTAADLRQAGTADGNVFVGMNSALGIGTADLADLQNEIADYQNANGALVDYGALVVLDKNVTIGAGYGMTITAQSISAFDDYMSSTGTGSAFSSSYNGSTHTIANTMYFGGDTAVLVSANALNAQHTGATNAPQALVTFAANDAKLIADGGKIIVGGEVRANKSYTFFKDGDGKVGVVDITGNTSGAAIDVYTENNFLYGQINNENGGTLSLTVNNDGRAIMAGASDPVYTTLVAYAQGYNGTKTTAADGTTDTTDYLYHGYTTVDNGDGTTTQVKDTNYSNEFLQNVISTGNGRDAETVARLGMLGGVAQSAMAAGASTYDAIAGRMGVGSSMGNVTIANNTQGASLWLTPIYKNSESDGFEADNLDYGVDIDLYGVALGADFTMQNGVRVGAMFNVGSGDADGNGAGSAVSNDFDYYGFGVYAGYTYGAFSVLADVTYTVADNDVEGSTSLGQVSTSLDSTNLSVGVTGQYNLNLGGVDVTPHAGLRFSSIDIDDYDVADIASYDADSLNIFSIPVGVTIAKEFQGDAWTWKPSLDITVQGNFGDDSADGTVAWAGIDNLKADISSEVIDNFTYGATLGVAAQTGNFSMGLGINYTGSSNVDDYGVSANARFVF